MIVSIEKAKEKLCHKKLCLSEASFRGCDSSACMAWREVAQVKKCIKCHRKYPVDSGRCVFIQCEGELVVEPKKGYCGLAGRQAKKDVDTIS